MSARTLTICLGALIVVALPQASVAAEPAPPVTPIMERAFAFHEQGPDRLRQFINRTRMIYGLRQDDVVKAYEATRMAEAPSSVKTLASRPPRRTVAERCRAARDYLARAAFVAPEPDSHGLEADSRRPSPDSSQTQHRGTRVARLAPWVLRVRA